MTKHVPRDATGIGTLAIESHDEWLVVLEAFGLAEQRYDEIGCLPQEQIARGLIRKARALGR